MMGIRGLVACALALAAVTLAPGAARAAEVPGPICDGAVANCIPWCDENGGGSEPCVYKPDPQDLPNIRDLDHICLSGEDPCVTGLYTQVQHAGDTALEAAGTAIGAAYLVVGIATGAVGTVQQTVDELRDDPVCVAPFSPDDPLCVDP